MPSSLIPVNIITEDQLSSFMLEKLLLESKRPFYSNTIYDSGGCGYIKKNILKFNQAAAHVPYIVLVDLDKSPCPIHLRNLYFNGNQINKNLLFRIAIEEVESWILADRVAFAKLLQIPVTKIPLDTDTIDDPKEFLINLARESKVRSVKDSIVPKYTSSRYGPGYIPTLQSFILDHWRISRAQSCSPSLKRAFQRIKNLKFSYA